MTEHRVGIDVGGTKCLGVVVDAAGTVVDELRIDTPHDPERLIADVAGLAEVLLVRAHHRGVAVADDIGIGVPGLVTRRGVLRAAPNLIGVADLDVRQQVNELLGRPVHVDNDATCAAVAEWRHGAARGSDDAIVVTLGTGIGGGLVAGGRVQRGANGFAGEIGHMVVDAEGPACPCGRRGCWERFASGSAIGRLAAVAGWRGGDDGGEGRVRGEAVVAAARRGDAGALAVLDEFSHWVALGLSNLTNIVDPECFVLGGGVMEAHDVVLPMVRRHLADTLYAPHLRPHPDVRRARFGEHAGAIGAALLALTIDPR